MPLCPHLHLVEPSTLRHSALHPSTKRAARGSAARVRGAGQRVRTGPSPTGAGSASVRERGSERLRAAAIGCRRRAGRAAGASQSAAHSRSSGRRRVRATCLLLRLQDCLHPYLALLACCTCACYMQFASIASCFRAAVCLIVADFLAEQICTGC